MVLTTKLQINQENDNKEGNQYKRYKYQMYYIGSLKLTEGIHGENILFFKICNILRKLTVKRKGRE